MKASELITKLNELVKEHGDLDVMLINYDLGDVDIVWVGRSAILKKTLDSEIELEPFFTISD